MSITDIITACGVVIAAFAIVVTILLYQNDQHHQRAAQTREDLQEIIDDCGRFLHPLSEDAPYPILHTSAAIIKEFRANMKESCMAKDVKEKLHNHDLLLSICVEGWVSSTEILRMMNIVEELERKASSHNLRGKLLLICQASFLLAGIVSKVCSPKTFYNIMKELDPESCKKDDAEVVLNELAIELQKNVCQEFNVLYRDTLKQCLIFIQIAAGAFLHVPDSKLVRLGNADETNPHSRNKDVKNEMKRDTVQEKVDEENETNSDPVQKFEQKTTLENRVKQVCDGLELLQGKIDPQEHKDLLDLIKMIDVKCIALE